MSDLTPEERAAAARTGMTAERYAELKGVASLADWEALQATRREDEQHERLKQAIREALDERGRS